MRRTTRGLVKNVSTSVFAEQVRDHASRPPPANYRILRGAAAEVGDPALGLAELPARAARLLWSCFERDRRTLQGTARAGMAQSGIGSIRARRSAPILSWSVDRWVASDRALTVISRPWDASPWTSHGRRANPSAQGKHHPAEG